MFNLFKNQIRHIFRFPAVILLIGMIFFVNIIPQQIWSGHHSPLENILAINIPENTISLLIPILILLVLGPTLEKIYGSAKIMILFILPSIIGGLYFYLFSDINNANYMIITLASLLGIFLFLILKRHRMITKGILILFLFSVGCFAIFVVFQTDFPIKEMYVGFIIGLILAIFFKPQLFSQFVKMHWRKGLLQSALVVTVFCVLFYSPTFINYFDLVKEVTSQKNKILTNFNDNPTEHAIYETTKIIEGSVQSEFNNHKHTQNTEDGLYNSILQSIINLEDKVNVEMYTTDSAIVFDTLQQVLNDHPEVFYFEHGNSRFWSNGVFEIGYKYSSSTIEMVREKINNKVQTIVKDELKHSQSDFDKIKAFHDYIVLNTAYDYENYLANTVPDESYTILGTLLYRVAVCDGYAKSMQLLLNQIGIENRYVIGTVKGEGHAWNKVKIDGEWYNLDATWNDPVPNRPGKVSYDYFLVTDQQLAHDHQWDQEAYPAATDSSYMSKDFSTLLF